VDSWLSALRGADVKELIVDSFAGGGGASTGIELALGRSPDIAINHDDIALAMHEANHPSTQHLPHSIWKVDPLQVCEGRPVGLLWASPDCKHFSKAKGGKPVEKRIRDLAWVVVLWARQVKPRVIILENVEEFQTWGPLAVDGRPCPDRKGSTFKRWVGELKRLGYKVEHRELRACDYGAPTIRKRLFLVARCDGAPIVWPEPSHGDPKSKAVKSGRLKPWRTAAEIIDWRLACPSIFDTSEQIMEKYGLRAVRPLQPATMARIAKGVKRYVLDAAKPFIVNLTHHGGERTESVDDPFATITGAHRGEKAVVTPFVSAAQQGGSARDAREPLHTVTASRKDQNQIIAPHLMTMRNAQKPFQGAEEPTHTITSGGAHMHLVAAFMAKHFGGHETPGWPLDVPISTVTAQDHHAVVSAGLTVMKGSDRRDSGIDAPAPTATAQGGHLAETRAFLQKYYGSDQDPRLEEPLHTATAKARFGLVTVTIDGEPYVITDIGMRMLSPRELFRAQGFPESYIIDRKPDGSPISKTEQVSKCGNSVCPPMACALVGANYTPRDVEPVPEFLEAAE
jgi:DNA (cytosine-5)-methyltransferase 1